MMIQIQGRDSRSGSAVVPMVALLWVPAMMAAAHEWANGDYYGYGWIVPPVGVWLLWRRWVDGGQLRAAGETPAPWGLVGRMPKEAMVWVAAGILLPWFAFLRVLNHADAEWRLPIGLAGLTAAGVSHGLLGWCRGWRVSAGFWRITLFFMAALPLPSVVESRVVHTLTRAVLGVVARLFEWSGEPVVVAGELLMRNGVVVEVSEGCSGIRSFYWFVMGTWLFAELHRLAWRQVLALLAWAAGMAFAVNVVRTWTLAEVRFTFGEAAFEAAHDWVGLAAFVVSAALFQGFCSMITAGAARRR